ncbi:MAG: LysE family translocator [Beijerinckiaceae bacterium]|nr:LysE family translocator [Beijerinckiaceae bacterium]
MDTLTPYLPGLMLVFSAFAIAVGSPGPSNMAIMATSMEQGRRAGLILALGVTAGSFTWGLLAAFGVTALIAAHAAGLTIIKILGGLYLLWLAWRSARSALRAGDIAPSVRAGQPVSPARTLLRGYLMHITNPKAILSWTAIIAIGLKPDMPQMVVVALLAGCLVISFCLNCGYAIIFSSAPMVRGYRRARRGIEAALAGIFAFAGVKLLTARF